MDIADWRGEIDRIDSEILKLLNQRAQCSIEIGRIKRPRGLPVYSPERENFIIKRIREHNQGPLSDDGAQHIFERIIDESRKVEKDYLDEKNK